MGFNSVVVKHNTGYVFKYREKPPDHVIEDLKWVLEKHGYSVHKKPTKKITNVAGRTIGDLTAEERKDLGI